MLSEVCPSRQALHHFPMLLCVQSSFVWLLDILFETSNSTLSSNGFKYFAVVVSSETIFKCPDCARGFFDEVAFVFFQGAGYCCLDSSIVEM